jgi:hypothetical protein
MVLNESVALYAPTNGPVLLNIHPTHEVILKIRGRAALLHGATPRPW